MDNEIPEIEQTEAATKPRSPRRQAKSDRRVWVYKVIDGKNNELGSFPESTVGSPVERRIPAFVQEIFGSGEYKVDLRTAKGVPERTFPITISEMPNTDNAIDAEFEDVDENENSFDEFGPQGFGHVSQQTDGLSRAEVENILLKERLAMEQQQRANGQSESGMLLSLLQASWEQQRQFMTQQIAQMQAASTQPREDATAQALKMMEASLGMVTRARAIAEELAPEGGGGSGSGESSWLADGAKLVDSLGKTVGPAIPTIVSMLAQPATPPPVVYQPQPQQYQPQPVAPTPSPDLSNLAARAAAARNGNGSKPPVEEEQKA